MTFKIIHNLGPSSLSKLITDFPMGDPLLLSCCSPTISQRHHADLCIYITGCKLVAQLRNPACRRVLFYLCVLCVVFFFFNEPTFKNLEISHNSYSGISWKFLQSGNTVSPPHGNNQSRGVTWCLLLDEACVLRCPAPSTPCLRLWAYANAIYYQIRSAVFLMVGKHFSVWMSLSKVEKRKTKRTTYFRK